MAEKQFKYLIKVEPGANNNKYYRMLENDNGTFTVEYGRVGAPKPATETYPMSKWDSKLKEKLSSRKGYEDKTSLFAEVKQTLSSGGVVATDADVAAFIQMLQGFAQAQTSQTYLVQATSVTQKQIDEAQSLIDQLSSLAKGKFNEYTFNRVLTDLYKVIPRKMKSVGDALIYANEGYFDAKEKRYIVTGKAKADKELQKEILKLIDDEQSNLDSMAGQVSQNTAQAADTNKNDTLLDTLGLKLAPVKDASVLEKIKKQAEEHGHRVRRVFAVVNESTEKAFQAQLAKAADKTKKLFWHGSRRANWWSILQKGLLIRPSTAVYTGSMFGDGIYFASECDKSMGYTDGGRWTGSGRNGNVYMALYDVHIGKQYVTEYSDSSLNYRKIQAKGCDSTWGKKGPSLYRHEFIIYQSCQCTIRYIVEFAS